MTIGPVNTPITKSFASVVSSVSASTGAPDHLQGLRKPDGGGGVVRLDDDVMLFATTNAHTLNDLTVYEYDLAAETLQYGQLSEAGQAVYPQVTLPIPAGT